jgi:hypothetical protein
MGIFVRGNKRTRLGCKGQIDIYKISIKEANTRAYDSRVEAAVLADTVQE